MPGIFRRGVICDGKDYLLSKNIERETGERGGSCLSRTPVTDYT